MHVDRNHNVAAPDDDPEEARMLAEVKQEMEILEQKRQYRIQLQVEHPVLIAECPDGKELNAMCWGLPFDETRRIGLFAHMRLCKSCNDQWEGARIGYARHSGDYSAYKATLDAGKARLLKRLGIEKLS